MASSAFFAQYKAFLRGDTEHVGGRGLLTTHIDLNFSFSLDWAGKIQDTIAAFGIAAFGALCGA
jgi:hypothetical protein